MKKILTCCILCSIMTLALPAFAGTHGKNGKVTPKTIGAGALSLLVWPGLGQMMNDECSDKVLTHALLGFTVVFRFWSGYDAGVDRKGGVWENRI